MKDKELLDFLEGALKGTKDNSSKIVNDFLENCKDL